MLLILQNDPGILAWVMQLQKMHAGGFLTSIGEAAQRADAENYPLIRPLLLILKEKYPDYDRSKNEIGRGAQPSPESICECGHASALHSNNKILAYRICTHHDANGKYCVCGRFRLRKQQ